MTKMVATWRVDLLYFIFKLEDLWGQDCLSAVAKKSRDDKEKPLLLFFSDFEGTLD